MLDAAREARAFIEGQERTALDIDLDEVWSTVTNDLPPLIVELEKVIPSDSKGT
jgi:hypothetical protein